MYDAFVDRVSRDSGVGIGYSRTGSLQVAMAGESARRDCKVIAGRALRCRRRLRAPRREERQGGRAAAFTGRRRRVVRSNTRVRRRCRICRERCRLQRSSIGARVRVPARATPHRDAATIVIDIQLDNDRVTARHVVLAAGSWSGQIAIDGVPPLPVRPVRGQLLQLAWDGPALNRIVWGSRCYLVPASAGTILVGATVEDAGFDERTTVAGVRDLLDAACDLVPRLWQATFVGARVGLRPATDG